MQTAQSHDNRLVHITQVDRGLACRCVCLACGEPVVARQGIQREWHFAHASNLPPCDISPETMLHRFVKQVIEEVRGIWLPELPSGRVLTPKLQQSCSNGWITFDRVVSEVLLGSIRPDVIGYCGDERLLIEVAYSSFCGDEKRQLIEQLEICGLELDVSAFHPASFEPDRVRHAVLTDDSIKEWLVTREQVVPPTPEPMAPAKIREYRTFVIASRNVQMKTLPWGDIALSYLYSEEVSRLVRHVAKRYQGRWNDRYKNWIVSGCFLKDVECELVRLQAAN